MLTKGNFTRNEWNNLLYLFIISHFSSVCCSQNFRLTSCTKTMAKRMQEQEGDNRIVAESKPTTMNLAFSVSTSSSTVNSPIASKSPGILKAPCRTDWSSTGKLVATEEEQEHLNCPEDSVSTGKLVAPGNPGNSGNSGTEGNDEDWPHNLHISTNYVLHMEKVFSTVRQRYGLSPTDQKKDFDVNTAMCSVYLCVPLFKLQFILVETTRKVYDLPRINSRNL